MKVAVIGSRTLAVPNLGAYLPLETTEIVSGGARGVDSDAAAYAAAHGLPLTEFRPDYATYGRAAPLLRNLQIIDYCDLVLAFWDGQSRGTSFVIDRCHKQHKALRVFMRRTAP